MDKSDTFSWQASLTHTYQALIEQLLSSAPQLLGALALLVAGWLLASVLRIITRKVVRGFDVLFNRLAKSGGVRQEAIKRSYAKVVSKIVFWTVMIFFIAAAANLLGWNMFSAWMNKLIAYLPNMFAGLLIILAGFVIANLARTGVVNATVSAGIAQGEMLARIAQVVILFTALVVGIEQIGINVDFLTNVLVVVIGVLLAGAALAFGLGAKTLVANTIGAQYVRKHCRIGEIMRLNGIEGSVVEVTQTTIILEDDSGRTVIPGKCFQEHISSFRAGIKGVNTKNADGDGGAQ